jgi:monomeric isocitrate dehydrogenase
MKTKNTILAMLMLVICFTTSNSFGQTKTTPAMMKDCCMMKDGKMMMMKDGKMMSMEKDMTMKNGTKCMVNGECVMKDGKKMQMKEGECIDMSGKMDHCSMMNKNMKGSKEMKSKAHNMAMAYTCPMHPEVKSDKPGKCPKCGMDMVEKK